MPYSSLQDLIAASSEREVNDLLDSNNDGVHDANLLNRTIAQADSIIDGYLASEYGFPLNVPLEQVPLTIKTISTDITRYRLWNSNAPEEVRNRYKDAMQQLKDLQKGVMVLIDVVKSENNLSGGGVDYFAEDRVFTRESLSGY